MIIWQKSIRSGNGGNCVEVARVGGQGTACPPTTDTVALGKPVPLSRGHGPHLFTPRPGAGTAEREVPALAARTAPCMTTGGSWPIAVDRPHPPRAGRGELPAITETRLEPGPGRGCRWSAGVSWARHAR